MKITFLGAAETVTGSKFLISHRDKHILVDCGLYQGYKELRQRNWEQLPIDPASLDAVILTHAHIDHSGYVPLLIKNGYKGKIYSTHGTKALCEILLPDSGHLHEEDARLANKYGSSRHKPALPLYTEQEARKSLLNFAPFDYDTEITLYDDFHFTFIRAGHIIGSSFVKIKVDHKTIVFTGDIGRPLDAVMRAPETYHPYRLSDY